MTFLRSRKKHWFCHNCHKMTSRFIPMNNEAFRQHYDLIGWEILDWWKASDTGEKL